MSNIPINKNVLPNMAVQSKTSYWCEVTKTWNVKVYAAVRSTPFIVKASKEGKITKSKKPKKAAKKTVEVNDFYRKLFKDFPLFLPDYEVVDLDDSNDGSDVANPVNLNESNDDHEVVNLDDSNDGSDVANPNNFNDNPGVVNLACPPFMPDSPPFSDGQINEFQCQHCGIHKDLDDETWNACPYAIFHGLMKNGDDQRDNQSPVFSSSPNPKPKKFKEKPSKKETE